MGQISIPMANKVGYSMYWNSMWDNKINFSSSLKEDVFIKSFLNLLFEDKFSKNLIENNRNFNYKNINLKKYNVHIKPENQDNISLKKYLFSLYQNDITYSKVWIIKYQTWVIVHFFLYLPLFNKLKIREHNIYNDEDLADLFGLYNNYLLTNIKLKYTYSNYHLSSNIKF